MTSPLVLSLGVGWLWLVDFLTLQRRRSCHRLVHSGAKGLFKKRTVKIIEFEEFRGFVRQEQSGFRGFRKIVKRLKLFFIFH
jgi:hypothetical protein